MLVVLVVDRGGRKRGVSKTRDERRGEVHRQKLVKLAQPATPNIAAAPDRWLFSFLSAQQKWPAPEKSLRRQSSSPPSNIDKRFSQIDLHSSREPAAAAISRVFIATLTHTVLIDSVSRLHFH